MNRRPRSITVISWIFIVVGSIALLYHLGEMRTQPRFKTELVWICFVRLLAVVSGGFMLRGFNWARWLLVVWLAFHVIISGFHSPFQLIVHGLLMGVITYLLFRPPASAYFRGQWF